MPEKYGWAVELTQEEALYLLALSYLKEPKRGGSRSLGEEVAESCGGEIASAILDAASAAEGKPSREVLGEMRTILAEHRLEFSVRELGEIPDIETK